MKNKILKHVIEFDYYYTNGKRNKKKYKSSENIFSPEGKITETLVYNIDLNDELYLSEKVIYDSEENILNISRYDDEGIFTDYENFSYDKFGRLIAKEINYLEEGIYEIEKIKYDRNDRVSRILIYDECNEILQRVVFKYDEKNQKCETFYYIDDGYLMYKQLELKNKNGQTTDIILYKSNGEVDSKIIRKYDEKKRLVEETSYLNDTDISEKQIYKYSKDGRKEERFFYDKNNEMTKKIITKYNQKGETLESTHYDLECEPLIYTVFKYFYYE
ncbi:MAG: hypothetical protein JW917_01650 [Ignavibacteria bacterium]|nr:hypothetical protein [Ignavibacteria bacterium]